VADPGFELGGWGKSLKAFTVIFKHDFGKFILKFCLKLNRERSQRKKRGNLVFVASEKS